MLHAFTELLIMLKLAPATGRKDPEELDRREVYADVYSASQTAVFNAIAAGQRIDLLAKMYKDEYENFTHVEHDGVRYKIAGVSPAEVPQMIKLTLVRGG